MHVEGLVINEAVARRAPAGSIMVYTDADWASDGDRKSNSGFVVWVKGSHNMWYMVSHGSKKQGVIALSSG